MYKEVLFEERRKTYSINERKKERKNFKSLKNLKNIYFWSVWCELPFSPPREPSRRLDPYIT